MGPRKRGPQTARSHHLRPTRHRAHPLPAHGHRRHAGRRRGGPQEGSPVVEPMRWDDADDAQLFTSPRPGTGRRFNGGAGAESRRLSPTPSPAPARRRRPWSRPTTTTVHRYMVENSLRQITTPTMRWRSPQKLTAKSNQQGPGHGAYGSRADSNEVGRSHRAAFELARPSRAPTATPTTTSPG